MIHWGSTFNRNSGLFLLLLQVVNQRSFALLHANTALYFLTVDPRALRPTNHEPRPPNLSQNNPTSSPYTFLISNICCNNRKTTAT
ncbi:mCG1050983 [Mus musculus]|nr:mCG1050983 [Mus musculus]